MTRSIPDEGWIGSWSPGIGDPTFAGWFTAFAYLATAYLCYRVQRRVRAASPVRVAMVAPFSYALTGWWFRLWALPLQARLGALWSGMTALMLFLGINKQLDLQTALTEIGRMVAHTEGWYEIRRKVQIAFIGGILVVGGWLFVAMLALVRGGMRRVWPVLCGTVFLICFVAIRAASFHHIDRLLHMEFAGLKLNWILELGGIALVAYGALRAGATGA